MKTLLHLIAAITLTMLSLGLSAQDMIYLSDGSSIKATNINVSPETVKYQKHNTPNGPFYSISVEKVASIVYASGKRLDFKEIEHKDENAVKPDPFFENTGNQQMTITTADEQHSVGFNFAMLIARQLEVDYEYRFKNTLLGVSVPLVYNMDPTFLTTPGGLGLKFSGGADMNFYVWREDMDMTSYELVTGLGVDLGQSEETYQDSLTNTTNFFTVYGLLGFRIYAGKNISFEGVARIGGRNYMDSKYTDLEPIVRPHLRVRFHF